MLAIIIAVIVMFGILLCVIAWQTIDRKSLKQSLVALQRAANKEISKHAGEIGKMEESALKAKARIEDLELSAKNKTRDLENAIKDRDQYRASYNEAVDSIRFLEGESLRIPKLEEVIRGLNAELDSIRAKWDRPRCKKCGRMMKMGTTLDMCKKCREKRPIADVDVILAR